MLKRKRGALIFALIESCLRKLLLLGVSSKMSSASAGCGWNRGSNHEELHLDDREDGDNHQMSPDERKSTTSTTSDATTAFLLFDEEDGLVSKCSPTCDDLLQLRASLLDPQYAHPRDYPL